jgi:hypothetical protein
MKSPGITTPTKCSTSRRSANSPCPTPSQKKDFMEPIKVFFIEPTNKHERCLRRYTKGSKSECAAYVANQGLNSTCMASNLIDVVEARDPCGGTIDFPHDDPRWPVKCRQCGKPFSADDEWIVDFWRLYRAADGRLWTLHDAPAGACWNAHWIVFRHGKRTPLAG